MVVPEGMPMETRKPLTVELIVLVAPGLTVVMGGNVCPRETLSNLSAACA